MADAFVAQLQALLNAQDAADRAQAKSNVDQALIDWGQVPDWTGLGYQNPYLAQDIDPATIALANQATEAGLSGYAHLNKAHDEAINRVIPNAMAARGMLSSGENAWAQVQEGQGYKQNLYDAGRKLINYVSGVYAGYGQNQNARAQQLLQAQQDAAQRAADAAMQAQQNAAMMAASGGGGDMGGALPPDPSSGIPPPPPDILAPSDAEKALMAAGVKQAARFRKPNVEGLFTKYSDWRGANPNWWK